MTGAWANLGLPQGYGYNPGFSRGIRIGSVKTGVVSAFIPDPDANVPPAPAGAADYGAEVDAGN
ncbi:MAG: hypothetical protein DMG30_27730 [Acidobacteria bacterium]|nr:MAG: hypothetical protein DMG30_27730 [Acidobacteriota bacterium]